jgi:hypothetical protein
VRISIALKTERERERERLWYSKVEILLHCSLFYGGPIQSYADELQSVIFSERSSYILNLNETHYAPCEVEHVYGRTDIYRRTLYPYYESTICTEYKEFSEEIKESGDTSVLRVGFEPAIPR